MLKFSLWNFTDSGEMNAIEIKIENTSSCHMNILNSYPFKLVNQLIIEKFTLIEFITDILKI